MRPFEIRPRDDEAGSPHPKCFSKRFFYFHSVYAVRHFLLTFSCRYNIALNALNLRYSRIQYSTASLFNKRRQSQISEAQVCDYALGAVLRLAGEGAGAPGPLRGFPYFPIAAIS